MKERNRKKEGEKQGEEEKKLRGRDGDVGNKWVDCWKVSSVSNISGV